MMVVVMLNYNRVAYKSMTVSSETSLSERGSQLIIRKLDTVSGSWIQSSLEMEWS